MFNIIYDCKSVFIPINFLHNNIQTISPIYFVPMMFNKNLYFFFITTILTVK
jgi:hypothetical protein